MSDRRYDAVVLGGGHHGTIIACYLAPADLVVVPADTVTAAVMDHPQQRLVIHDGRVVARDGQLV